MFQVTQRGGRRWSTADALPPARAGPRPNLRVVTGAQALGLELRAGGSPVCATRRARPRPQRGASRARGDPRRGRDRLAAADAPLGHRPARHLREVGVQVRHELPGRGRAPPGPPVHDGALRGERPAHALRRRQAQADGRVAPAPARPAHLHRRRGGRLRAHAPRPAGGRPPVPHRRALLRGPRRRGVRRPRRHDRAGAGVAPQPRAGVAALERPARQAAHPHQQLAERDDVESLVAGVRLAREIAEQEPLACTIVRELRPGAEFASDEDIEASLRSRIELIYHPVGTCAMGDGEDRGGRPGAACARARGAARGGRLGDAADPRRQHQRADDHDRRARRRPDPRPAAQAVPLSPAEGRDRGRGLQRHRHGDRPEARGHRGLHDLRAGRRPRRGVAPQHLSRRGLRRALVPLLVLL